MTGPSSAEVARTAVASARIAALTTYPRRPPVRPTSTCVAVEADASGRPVLRMPAAAVAAQQLLLRPLATVRVGPPGLPTVTLQGRVERLVADGPDACFRVEPGAVRLGDRTPEAVPVEAYEAAAPDPLTPWAGPLLAHLRAGHAPELTACLRARGHDAAWVEPTGLDRYGLAVAVVTPAGVEAVRLDFPAPVDDLDDLGPGLRGVLLCRCARGGGGCP